MITRQLALSQSTERSFSFPARPVPFASANRPSSALDSAATRPRATRETGTGARVGVAPRQPSRNDIVSPGLSFVGVPSHRDRLAGAGSTTSTTSRCMKRSARPTTGIGVRTPSAGWSRA